MDRMAFGRLFGRRRHYATTAIMLLPWVGCGNLADSLHLVETRQVSANPDPDWRLT